MDNQDMENRRFIETQKTKWKIVYYCELLRNKKSDQEARRIADEKVYGK